MLIWISNWYYFPSLWRTSLNTSCKAGLSLFSRSVMSNSLWPRGLQQPGFPVLHYLPEFVQTHVHWVDDASLSLSSCPQSSPASVSFPMSQLFTSGGQRIGFSALVSVLPMNIQDWSPLGLIGLISLLSKGLSRVFSSTIVQKHQFFGAQSSLWSNSLYMTTGKTIALTIWTFVGKAMSLLFNMRSRFVIAFLPKSKLQSPSAVILEPKKIVCHCFHFSPIYLPWSDETRCHDFHFLNVKY